MPLSPLKPTIAVDFDGTVVNAEYPEIGSMKAGVREALATFRRIGYQIIIYSCRSCFWYPEVFGGGTPQSRAPFQNMKLFLDANDIPYDEIDDGTKGKAYAALYIDDKGMRFQDNWHEIERWVDVNRPK